MDILVTGASGKAGKYVARRLAAAGHNVTNLDRIPPPEDLSEIAWVQADILDCPAMRDLVRGYDAVVHLAGIPIPLYHAGEEVFRTNVLGTYNVLDGAAANGIPRFVYMSSESTLGFAFMERHMDPCSIPITEKHPLRPQDAYGMSKVAAEAACQAVARRTGMETVILRSPWIWVPEPEDIAMYRQLVRDPDAWYKQMWAFCGVEDLAAAIEAAVTRPMVRIHGGRLPAAGDIAPAPVFFVCADDNWTGQETLPLLKAHYTVPAGSVLPGTRSVISNALAGAALDFRPVQKAGDFV